MEPLEYKILTTLSPDKLGAIVTQHLAQGWQLEGSLVMTQSTIPAHVGGDEPDTRYAQVVTRYQERK